MLVLETQQIIFSLIFEGFLQYLAEKCDFKNNPWSLLYVQSEIHRYGKRWLLISLEGNTQTYIIMYCNSLFGARYQARVPFFNFINFDRLCGSLFIKLKVSRQYNKSAHCITYLVISSAASPKSYTNNGLIYKYFCLQIKNGRSLYRTRQQSFINEFTFCNSNLMSYTCLIQIYHNLKGCGGAVKYIIFDRRVRSADICAGKQIELLNWFLINY